MLKPKISRRLFVAGTSAAVVAAIPALVPRGRAQEIKGVNESGIMSPEVQRCGMRLACLCGACKNTVGDCAMLECGYCAPMRKRIAAMQAEGHSDDDIVAAIVKESGKQALAVPPTEGFSFFAWAGPWIAIAIGLAAIWMFIKRFSHKPAPAAADVDPEVLDRYQERIEKELDQ